MLELKECTEKAVIAGTDNGFAAELGDRSEALQPYSEEQTHFKAGADARTIPNAQGTCAEH